MAAARLTLSFASVEAFLATFDGQIRGGSVTVPGTAPPGSALFDECVLAVRVGAEPAVEVSGWIATIDPGIGLGVLLRGVPPALATLAERLRGPAAPGAVEAAPPTASPDDTATNEAVPRTSPGPESIAAGTGTAPARAERPSAPWIAARLDVLGVTEKMRLALSGNRDERLALLRDVNKVLHLYVLRNPRLALDEVQYASKLANLAPEALKFIAEHAQWGADPTTCANLVRNPKTPLQIAIRLLDRLTPADLRLVARSGARQALVSAARKRLIS